MTTVINRNKRGIALVSPIECARPRKILNITSSLSQHRMNNESTNLKVLLGSQSSDTSPHLFLTSELKLRGIDVSIKASLLIEDFFLEPTQEQIDGYSNDVVQAVRSGDLEKLRSIYESGRSLQLCNRFGESLIHMACRRGNMKVVEYLLKDAGVSIRVRDDYGRTPMHDACWTAKPNFELMDMLSSVEPRLLFVSDARGHTPLQYVRREHWGDWIKYLLDKCQCHMGKRAGEEFIYREKRIKTQEPLVESDI